jgi:hypothetical protein
MCDQAVGLTELKQWPRRAFVAKEWLSLNQTMRIARRPMHYKELLRKAKARKVDEQWINMLEQLGSDGGDGFYSSATEARLRPGICPVE